MPLTNFSEHMQEVDLLRFLTRHRDAWVHAAGAVPFTLLWLWASGDLITAACLNAAGWAWREWDQTGFVRPPWHWSRSKHIEWLAPAIAGCIVALVLGAA